MEEWTINLHSCYLGGSKCSLLFMWIAEVSTKACTAKSFLSAHFPAHVNGRDMLPKYSETYESVTKCSLLYVNGDRIHDYLLSAVCF